MISRILFAWSVALLFIFPGQGFSQDIKVQSDSTDFRQGGMIAGMLNDSTQDHSYRIRLEAKDGSSAASSESFFDGSAHFFVLPLRFDLSPGEYKLRAVPLHLSGRQLKTVPVTVIQEEFPYQEISLTRQVSDVRRTIVPRRVEESEHLWSVISKVNLNAVHHRGPMQMPLDSYRVSSEFAHQRVFIYDDGTSDKSIHWGWDLAAPQGTPLFAPGSGRVVIARDRIITGNSIIIEHLPGIFSLLYHLDSMYVQEGDVVSIGEVIGTVGTTGVSTGPHLHWEIRIRTIPVHPRYFLTIDILDTDLYLPHIGIDKPNYN